MPVELIKSKIWLDQTGRLGTTRSKELKAVDEALRAYDTVPTDLKLEKVRDAFAKWKNSKPADWEDSKRNRSGIVSLLEDRLTGRADPRAAGLENAREGMLYLFANTKVKGGWASLATESTVALGNGFIGLERVQQGIGVNAEQLLGAAIAGDVAGRHTEEASRVLDAAGKVVQGKFGKAKAKAAEIVASIIEYFKTLGRRMKDSVVETWNTATSSGKGFLKTLDDLSGYVESAVNIVLSYVLEKIAPFVASGMVMARGVKDAVMATMQRVTAYRAQKGLQFHTGHPAVIFRQIETAMELSIAKGVYQAVKGAGLFTADMLTFGTSAVVSLIATGVELLFRLITRIIEMARMKRFFVDCEPLWAEVESARGRTDPATGRAATSALVADAAGFADWFKNASFAMPCLSMIALNSGIVGDKLRMMRIYAGSQNADGQELDKRGKIIDKMFDDRQDKFNQGVKYIDKLKSWGANYLDETGFKFFSENSMVDRYLSSSSSSTGAELPEFA